MKVMAKIATSARTQNARMPAMRISVDASNTAPRTAMNSNARLINIVSLGYACVNSKKYAASKNSGPVIINVRRKFLFKIAVKLRLSK